MQDTGGDLVHDGDLCGSTDRGLVPTTSHRDIICREWEHGDSCQGFLIMSSLSLGINWRWWRLAFVDVLSDRSWSICLFQLVRWGRTQVIIYCKYVKYVLFTACVHVRVVRKSSMSFGFYGSDMAKDNHFSLALAIRHTNPNFYTWLTLRLLKCTLITPPISKKNKRLDYCVWEWGNSW